MITDLDKPDAEFKSKSYRRKKHKHGDKSKTIHHFSDVFQPTDELLRYEVREKQVNKLKKEIHELRTMIKIKDEQVSKLVQKVSDLHICNNQFASENQKLQREIENLQGQYSQNSTRCENCLQLVGQTENLLKNNKNLHSDIDMLKILVHRLNMQIERYQEKFTDENPVQFELCPTFENWGTINQHTLFPLLSAYEEIVKEKTDLVHHNELEMRNCRNRLKEIFAENESLQEILDQQKADSINWKEEKVRLEVQLEICRKKVEIQSKRADLAKAKLVDVLKCYEQKVEEQSLDLERLQEAYARSKNDLAALRSHRKDPNVMVDGLKECQKLFEELKSEHETERQKVKNELIEVQHQNVDMTQQVIASREENVRLKKTIELHKHTIKKYKEFKNSFLKLLHTRENLLRSNADSMQVDTNRGISYNKAWKMVKELDYAVKKKEADIKGLENRHRQEIEKYENRLRKKDETIKNILKEKIKS